ncbi:MAG: DUF3662 domain-containing protein [Negativicutes bacterium]|nr:DUF3662 domain-containing protein [Negativicutes bacterium]
MALLGRLEKLLADNLEGFFQRRFAGRHQPVEIAHLVVKGLEDYYGQQQRLPGQMVVRLPAPDWQAYREALDDLAADLADCLVEYCRSRDYRGERVTVTVERGDGDEVVVECHGGDDAISTQRFDRGMMPGRAERVTATVVVLRTIGAGDDREYRLPERQVFIGRGINSFISLDDCSVSRQHASIGKEGGRWVICDNNSLNGVHVNGVRIRRQELNPGDRIKIGNSQFEFCERTMSLD